MNKLGRGLHYTTYQSSVPVLTLRHHMNRLDTGPQGDAIYSVPNIKALCLSISEKNFEICLLCSYVLTCDPWAGPDLTPGLSSYEHTLYRSIRRCYIPNIKALRLLVSEVFKDFAISFPLVAIASRVFDTYCMRRFLKKLLTDRQTGD